MTSLLHHRLANWLTGLVVAIWPVATAHACCCGPGAGSEGNKCASGCSSAAAESSRCCNRGVDDEGTCCVRSAERVACGCGVQCGQLGAERNAAGTVDKSSTAPIAALAGGWIAAWPAISDVDSVCDGDGIPQRPKRILYSVWRN